MTIAPGMLVQVRNPDSSSRFRTCPNVGVRGVVTIVDPWRASCIVRTDTGHVIGEPIDHLVANRPR